MNYQFAFLFLLSCMLHLGLYSVHGQFCLGSEFTTNGTYQANLNSLLSSLSSNVTLNTRFYNATAGGNPDKIFGFLLCRGDVTLEACHVCANTSTKETQQKCPNNKETILWDNDCLLWYSNRDIFLTMEESPFAIWNPNNVTDPNRFKQILEDLINDLAKQAAFSSSTSMFATGEANFTSSQKIYGLVQCIPIISQNNCNRCLVGVLADMPNGFNQRQGGRLLRPSCYVQFENYLFYKLNADTSVSSSLLPPLPPPLQPLTNTTLTEGKGGISFRTVIIIVIPTVVAITFLSILCFFLRRRKPKDKANGVGEIISTESLQFDFETIKVATDNFSDANKLGQGGFGAVYKGWLFNGQEIAVKRLSRISRQGEVEFMNEVVLVAKLQHRNLVRLLGFCLERDDKLLIYEFMPNTSLDHFIFDPIKRSQLDWERRYKIIKGIARGLLYLHEDSRLKIIHRDLKPNNILLDGELNPRISDFGMARLFEVDQTQDNASRIVGTYGYMAPEYAMHGRFSVKSDVFSFGVLLLEIVSGQKNNTFCQSELAENLLSYAWRQWREGMALELMDSTFRDNCLRNEVMRCIHIGLLCVQENVADRPTMTSIVLMLNSNSVTLPLPSSPAYFVHSRMDQSTRNPTPRSVNDVSITELSPR